MKWSWALALAVIALLLVSRVVVHITFLEACILVGGCATLVWYKWNTRRRR